MDPHDLQLFLTLCRTRHFRKASQERHVAPSTLTRAIQRLEEESGATLFVRDHQQVELTPAGLTFREYAREAVGAWDAVRARMQMQESALTGRLRLFCTVTASYSILPDLLPDFMHREPGVRLELFTGDADEALPRVLDGTVDMAVAVLPESLPDGIEAREVTRTPLVCIAPTREGAVATMCRKRPLPWHQLPLVVPEAGMVRETFLGWVAAKGVTPQISGTVSGHEAILALVTLGLGVGALPEIVLERCRFPVEVRPLSLRPALPMIRVGICVHRQRLADPCVRAFWDAIGPD